MKKYLIVIICLSISSSWFTNIAAQQAKNTMGLLTQNEWVFPLNDNKGKNLGAIVCRFTPIEYINIIEAGEPKYAEIKYKYYLSDKIEKTFDDNKVGKVLNGKYIIVQMSPENINVLEIINNSDSDLEFQIVEQGKPNRTKSTAMKTYKFKAKSKLT